MENVKDNVVTLIATYGLDVVAAIVILIIGLIAARWAQRLSPVAVRRARASTIRSALSSPI